MTATDPLAAALRLLAVRERSSAELTARLLHKGFDTAGVEAALRRCRELGYLDDRRYARERARALLRSGRAVGPRILADLKGRGIGDQEARQALAEAQGETPDEALLAALVERRFPGFSYPAAAERERRRVLNYILRRGFSLPLVLSFFKEER